MVQYFAAEISNSAALIFEILAQAVAAHPTVAALNHARWTLVANGGVTVDTPSGPLLLWPGVILNAVGAWIDPPHTDPPRAEPTPEAQ